jgi:hypothetical protein
MLKQPVLHHTTVLISDMQAELHYAIVTASDFATN